METDIKVFVHSTRTTHFLSLFHALKVQAKIDQNDNPFPYTLISDEISTNLLFMILYRVVEYISK